MQVEAAHVAGLRQDDLRPVLQQQPRRDVVRLGLGPAPRHRLAQRAAGVLAHHQHRVGNHIGARVLGRGPAPGGGGGVVGDLALGVDAGEVLQDRGQRQVTRLAGFRQQHRDPLLVVAPHPLGGNRLGVDLVRLRRRLLGVQRQDHAGEREGQDHSSNHRACSFHRIQYPAAWPSLRDSLAPIQPPRGFTWIAW